MTGKIRKIALVTLLIASLGGVFYLHNGNNLYAKDGIPAGKIGSVDKSKNEIIANTVADKPLNIGDRIYVRIDGIPVIMKVTFPMMTSSRCSVEKKYINQIGLIEKGMPLYKYEKGVENESVEDSSTVIKPKKMSNIKIISLPKGFRGGFSDSRSYFSEGLAIVYGQNDNYGFIDKSGKLVIPAIYTYGFDISWGDDFTVGIVRIRKDSHSGYINKSGKLIIENEYDGAGNFSEGLAAVNKEEKYGYINKEGKVVIAMQYDDGNEFSEGLAAVLKGGKWIYIDTTGKKITLSEYDGTTFYEGLAKIDENEKYGYMNKEGKTVIDIQYDEAENFSEGLAAVEKNGKKYFINKEGKTVIEIQYDEAENFSEGLAAVKKNEKWGFIDTTGKEIIPCQYDRDLQSGGTPLIFSEGLTVVSKERGGKSGYIDKSGNIIIPFELDSGYIFKEGAAFINYKGKEGFILNPLNEK